MPEFPEHYVLRNGLKMRKIADAGMLKEDMGAFSPTNGWYETLAGVHLCLSTGQSRNPLGHKGGLHGEGFDVVAIDGDVLQ